MSRIVQLQFRVRMRGFDGMRGLAHRRRRVSLGARAFDGTLERGVGFSFLFPRSSRGDGGRADPLVSDEHGNPVTPADWPFIRRTRCDVAEPGRSDLEPEPVAVDDFNLGLADPRPRHLHGAESGPDLHSPALHAAVLAVHLDVNAVGVAPRGLAPVARQPQGLVAEGSVQRALPVLFNLVQKFHRDGRGGSFSETRDHDGVFVGRRDQHPLVGLRRADVHDARGGDDRLGGGAVGGAEGGVECLAGVSERHPPGLGLGLSLSGVRLVDR